MENIVSSMISTNNCRELKMTLDTNEIDLRLVEYKKTSVEIFKIIINYVRKNNIGAEIILKILYDVIFGNDMLGVRIDIIVNLIDESHDIFGKICEHLADNGKEFDCHYYLINEEYSVMNDYFTRKFIEYLKKNKLPKKFSLVSNFIKYCGHYVVDLLLQDDCDSESYNYMYKLFEYSVNHWNNRDNCMVFMNPQLHKLAKKIKLGKIYDLNNQFINQSVYYGGYNFELLNAMDSEYFNGRVLISWIKLSMKHSQYPEIHIRDILTFILSYSKESMMDKIVNEVLPFYPVIFQFEKVRNIFTFNDEYNIVFRIEEIKNNMKQLKTGFSCDILKMIKDEKTTYKKYMEYLRLLIKDYYYSAVESPLNDDSFYIIKNYIKLMDY